MSRPIVGAVIPSAGPTSGGSTAAVFGAFFSRRAGLLTLLSCKFNSTLAAAVWQSPTLLHCVSPSFSACRVSLDVANAPPDFSDSQAVFRLVDVVIYSASPLVGPLLGNTLLTVHGTGFVPSFTLGHYCVFADLSETEATVVSSSALVCPTPAAPKPMLSSLRLRLDGSDVDTGVQFLSDAHLVVNDILPRFGPQDGGTSLLITGHRFTLTPPHIFCRFGDIQVQVRVVSPNELTCATPPVASAMNVTLALVRGQSGPPFYDTYFEFEPSTVIYALNPDRGPREGGSRIALNGEGFSYRAARVGALQCRFNASNVMGEYLSPKTIICIAPAHAPGTVTVEVTNNLQQYTSSGLTFIFDTNSVRYVHPAHGPVLGGSLTIISVSWTMPPLHDSLSCLFGSDGAVLASFDALGRVSCVSPPSTAAGAVMVSISSSYASCLSSVTFTYEEEPVLDALHPVMGPAQGGTLVAIFGSDFHSTHSLWCKFTARVSANETQPGSIFVVAHRVSSTNIECVSPRAPLGFSTVQLTFNGHNPCSENSLLFEYIPATQLFAVVPPRGTASGQVPVHVYGSEFSRRAARLQYLFCKFGNTTSVATLSPNGGEIICLLPAGKPGFVTLEVSQNTQDFSKQNSLVFEYQAVSLAAVAPSNGPVSGGTLLTVTGTGFIGSQIYGTQCVFGDKSVEAIFISQTKIICVTPSARDVDGTSTTSSTELSLRLSGHKTHGALLYHFLTTLAIKGAHPMVGPVLGGTTVVIDGDSFSANSFCRFHTTVVLAQFISAQRIQCTTPAHAVGLVSVTVSSNNQNFFGVDDQFEFTPTATLASIFPYRGPVDGNTLTSVFGAEFHERSASLVYLTCRFNTTAVPAIFISANEVKCYTPEMPIGVANVAISNNEQDYHAGVTFEYVVARLFRVEPPQGPIAGGTRIYVIGVHFTPGDIFCRLEGGSTFGASLVSATFISMSVIICLTPPGREEGGAALLSIENNDARYLSTAYFHYIQPPQLLAIEPSLGPTLGGTRVSVYGRGFVASMDLLGLFVGHADRAAVPVKITSEASLELITPEAKIHGDVQVIMSNTRFNIDSRVALLFMYTPPLSVRGIKPCKGPTNGGSTLSIWGDFPSTGILTCRFNSTVVSATRTTSGFAICRVPAVHRRGYVGFEMSANAQDYSTAGLLFEYRSYVLTSILPRQGPMLGGTWITVFGSGFMPATCSYAHVASGGRGSHVCAFDGESMDATQRTADSVVCRSPSRDLAVDIVAGVLISTVTIHVDDASYLGGLSFTYFQPVVVSSIFPKMGPALGGTRVAVHGFGFIERDASQIRCRFFTYGTGVLVLGRYRGLNQVDCIAPEGIAGTLTLVELSQNWPDGNNFSSSQAYFAYYAPPRIIDIYPQHLSTKAGSLVTVMGSGFMASRLGEMRCAFERIHVPATVVSPEKLLCPAPAGSHFGAVGVEISNNGHDYTQRGHRVQFVVLQLSQVLPATGPIVGGTQVTVSGSGFVNWDQQHWQCIWGDQEEWSSPATLEASTYLTCVTPKLSKSVVTLVRLRARVDGVTQTSALHFLYSSVLAISRIYPSHSPGHGGTVVTLSGQFSQAVEFCRFAAVVDGCFPPLPARYLSPTRVECTVPRIDHACSKVHGSDVAVELSVNGVDFSASSVSFHYLRPVKLMRLDPLGGPVQGGSSLTVYGIDLSSFVTAVSSEHVLIACSFNLTVRIPAVLASHDTLTCKTPPSTESGHVSVHVVSDGQMISSGLRFEYRDVRLLSVSPRAGPILGGTQVFVAGMGLPLRGVMCKFGMHLHHEELSMQIIATADSSTSAVCAAPPQSRAGVVGISVLCANTTCSNAIRFEYYEPPVFVDSAHLLFSPPGGPTLGGTRVEIYGSNFRYFGEPPSCRFGSSSHVPLLLLDRTRCVCISPPSNTLGSTSIWISLNGILDTRALLATRALPSVNERDSCMAPVTMLAA